MGSGSSTDASKTPLLGGTFAPGGERRNDRQVDLGRKLEAGGAGLGQRNPGQQEQSWHAASLHVSCFRLRLLASGFQQRELHPPHPLPNLKNEISHCNNSAEHITAGMWQLSRGGCGDGGWWEKANPWSIGVGRPVAPSRSGQGRER